MILMKNSMKVLSLYMSGEELIWEAAMMILSVTLPCVSLVYNFFRRKVSGHRDTARPRIVASK